MEHHISTVFKVVLHIIRHIDRMYHTKSPIAVFSMFTYIMQGTIAIPECESTLHHKNLTGIHSLVDIWGAIMNFFVNPPAFS